MADPKTIAAYQSSRESKLRSMGVADKPHEDKYRKAERLGHAPFYTSVSGPPEQSLPQDAGEGRANDQRRGPGYPTDVAHGWTRDRGEALPEFDHERGDRHVAHASTTGAGHRKR
jgi:hypothetical protein